MSPLFALPLLPLAVVAWLALSSRSGQLAAGWVVALVAAFPMAVAVLASSERIELSPVLILDTSAIVLDEAARAALLLFGGLWLTAGLLLTRTREPGTRAIPLLLAMSGALLLAIADGGPLVYAGMLVAGYGMYAVMAGEPGDDWRRAGRAMIVLLVVSDLLVFELLLSASADHGVGLRPGLLLLALLAVILRGGIPPAHVWLPPALAAVGTPTAVLLAAVPTGVALMGALKLLPDGAAILALPCFLLGLAGAAWATFIGIAQVEARATLAYALAATAALLLVAIPAGAGAGGQLAWLGLALLASCAALPLVALQVTGWGRDAAITLALLVHGLAGGHAAVHAAAALPWWAGLLAPLAAVGASVLLTLTALRTPALARGGDAAEATRLVLVPVILCCVGLGFAWAVRLPGFASSWIAPVGITLGLLVARGMPRRTQPDVAPGDLLGPVERIVAFVLRWLRVLFLRYLPRVQQHVEARVLRMWDGEAWSRRIQNLDVRLRAWPATSLMMLAVALSAAFLLAK